MRIISLDKEFENDMEQSDESIALTTLNGIVNQWHMRTRCTWEGTWEPTVLRIHLKLWWSLCAAFPWLCVDTEERKAFMGLEVSTWAHPGWCLA